jgi:hypothetical protein
MCRVGNMVRETTVLRCQSHDTRQIHQPLGGVTQIRHQLLLALHPDLTPNRPYTMPLKVNFFRLLAIPACLVWGILELISLQRARLMSRR